ncbi:hypothetical protein SVIO_036240 [Streptomyces violaceusniger]|uniref:Uncharacterized protein n=1 Tax=Streptomyces violaceusniger TaxID=68280 RepID=A0A4D4KUJ7_STRVO|nr:hypothetical protein SVIO_036240 [Streptomyces violaceusniger]
MGGAVAGEGGLQRAALPHRLDPRYTRYAAPTSFSAVKTRTERSTTDPTPSATATTSAYAPSVLPTTVVSAARRPWASARPTTKSTLGPGITISRNDMAAKASSRSMDTMKRIEARDRRATPALFPVA